MLNWLIRHSLDQRVMVLAGAAVVLFFGLLSATQLPVEVLPDLTKPTVTILTEAPGLAPEEVETLVTVPLESALMGVAGVTRLRTTSDVALSLIYVEFDWGSDIHDARVFVQERLQSVRESLPTGVQPFMTPVASLMGEIMLVGLTSPDGKVAGRDLRTIADWDVRLKFQSVPGIAEVLSMGGGIKQIQVQPNPEEMLAMGVSYKELKDAASEAASNTTGGFLTSGPREIMVRNLAMTTDLGEIAKTVVKYINDRPITIGDVAAVVWDTEPMRGDAAVDGKMGVILSITKSPGFDTVTLTDAIEAKIEGLRESLPPGVEIASLFKQSDFIGHAVGNLKHAILVGAVMVAIILFLFLFNFRTTLITLTAIPLSFAVTALVFRWFEISVNSMTLGGLAVAIGMVVDDAIVDVENVFRRLRENAASPAPGPRLNVIAKASAEVRHSILYATIFVILVFVPLLGLSGVEGRLFTPIAVATIVSMAASFVVSLTVIPVLCSLILRPKIGKQHRDGFIVRGLKSAFQHTWLSLSLTSPAAVMGIAAIMLAWAAAQYPNLGKDFLPSFQEETALVATTTAPGTSLNQTDEITLVAQKLLMSIPEVRKVGARVGRAERGDHVVPVSTVEFDIDFVSAGRPKGFFNWFLGGAEAEGEDGEAVRSRAEVMADIRTKMQSIKGTFSVLSGPLADRIGHMLSGVSAKVAVKVFGPDLNKLREIGTEIQNVARDIPGLEEARVEQQALIPQIRIEVNRDRAKAYGVTPGALNMTLSALIGGETVGELYEGQKTIDLVMRLPEEWRESPEKLENLYIDTSDGKRVPLRLIAEIRDAKGPNVIQRENTSRRFVVSINPTVRDLSTLVGELEKAIDEKVSPPPGYEISIEGEFRAQQEATRRIGILSLVIFVILAFLLYSYFQSAVFAVQVLCDIPLALIGGLLFTQMMNLSISVASLVGFIAVTGISSRNSVMLISHYLHLMKHEGEGFTRKMIERGTLERLVPVLMTALSAGIALIPLVLAANEPGKEILHPVAVVIVGGLVTSTFLGLGVTPAMFYAFGRKAAFRAIRDGASAAH